VRAVLDQVDELAAKHDSVSDILHASGAREVRELWDRPLEECDRLAAGVSVRAEHQALLEGMVPAVGGVAIPGIGGVAAAVVDVPVLFEASLRAIRRIGHCYGFPLDTVADRAFVLEVLELANENSPEKRIAECRAMRRMVDPKAGAGSSPQEVEVSGIQRSLVDDLPLEAVPVLGDLTSIALDYAFVCRVDVTARRVFQERWLQTHGKVDEIAPSTESRRRSSMQGVVGVAAEVTYTGAYGVAFGVTFPVALAGSLAASVVPGSVADGLRDGAAAASRDALGFLEGLRNGGESEPVKPATGLAPSAG
jgi:hypothetical protein